MATIAELIDQHMENLEALASQPVPETVNAAFDYAHSAVTESNLLSNLTLTSPNRRNLSVEEYEESSGRPVIFRVPEGDETTKIWRLPGRFLYFGESPVEQIAQNLDTITSKIEATAFQGPGSDELRQPICALGLNLTAGVISLSEQGVVFSSPHRLTMRATAFCSKGMREDRPEQNLFLLSQLDRSFTETAKFFAPCIEYTSMDPAFEGMDNGKLLSPPEAEKQAIAQIQNLSWGIDKQAAAELDADKLIRGESFLRAAKGMWERWLSFIDPVLQPACRERIDALAQGADSLRSIALGSPEIGHGESHDFGIDFKGPKL